MPTLNWIGKEKVVNFHHDVQYRVLERDFKYPMLSEESNCCEENNYIIHGDNLEALKSLLPQYERKIDCIYIDPPYNTGNSQWIYNDNVNDPRIKKWIGDVVGKDGEDLSRHDKWLCMMYPRLRLLEKLLSDNGSIFVSIDDGEVTNLRYIMDEIFGKNKFIAQLVWKSRQNKDNRNINNVSVDHEYVLCYGKALLGEKRKEDQYSNPDNDPRGPWTSANMVGLADEANRPNLHYDLIDPKTGINYGKPIKGWRYDRNSMSRLIEEERIIWPKNKNGRPRKKQFLNELEKERTGFSSIIGEGIFTNTGTKELKEIFDSMPFPFPKSSQLIQILVNQSTGRNSIVLDSFAGSGTTAHAVLNLNKMDGGNRRFILVEMEDYAESITAERVKRVIDGYSNVPGTGGSFNFFKLGESIFKENGMLNESIKIEKICAYIWYMETRQIIDQDFKLNVNNYFLGTFQEVDYYFYYEVNAITTLNYNFLERISRLAPSYVIFADVCTIDEKDLIRLGITFKKIPRDISRL